MKTRIWLTGIICLLASAFWGYQNHLKYIGCQELNQQLFAELKLANAVPLSFSLILNEGDSLPQPLTFSPLNGESLNIFREGCFLLIFISDTCPACHETGIELYSEMREFLKNGLQMVSVSRDSPVRLAALIKEKRWPLPLAHDAQGHSHNLFNVSGVPYVVLIEKGIVKLKANALSIDRRLPELKALLRAALPSQSPATN